MFIGGKWIDAENGRQFQSFNPASGETVGSLPAARNEVRYGADFLLWYAEEAKRVCGRTIPFLEELTRRVAVMKSGSGFDPGVRIGPLVNDTALEKVDRQVRDAIKKGARLVTGGERLTENGLDKGCFYAPTILTHVAPDMTIYRKETFGPVVPVIVYENEDDVLAMANDTHYGLSV